MLNMDRMEDAALIWTVPGPNWANTYMILGVKKVTPEPIEDENLPDDYRAIEPDICYIVLGKDMEVSALPLRAVEDGAACFIQPDSELVEAYKKYTSTLTILRSK
jgi:hypothetical protein